MTETLEYCSNSWVDLSKELSVIITSPTRTTSIPFVGDSDYLQMLKEAQHETSPRTSARTSPIMSKNSTRMNSRTPSFNDLSCIYINQLKEPEAGITNLDWTSRPNKLPPKDWKLQSQSSKSSNCCCTKPAKSKYSKNFMKTVVLSNIFSLIVGAGIGMWMYNKSDAESIKIFI